MEVEARVSEQMTQLEGLPGTYDAAQISEALSPSESCSERQQLEGLRSWG